MPKPIPSDSSEPAAAAPPPPLEAEVSEVVEPPQKPLPELFPGYFGEEINLSEKQQVFRTDDCRLFIATDGSQHYSVAECSFDSAQSDFYFVLSLNEVLATAADPDRLNCFKRGYLRSGDGKDRLVLVSEPHSGNLLRDHRISNYTDTIHLLRDTARSLHQMEMSIAVHGLVCPDTVIVAADPSTCGFGVPCVRVAHFPSWRALLRRHVPDHLRCYLSPEQLAYLATAATDSKTRSRRIRCIFVCTAGAAAAYWCAPLPADTARAG